MSKDKENAKEKTAEVNEADNSDIIDISEEIKDTGSKKKNDKNEQTGVKQFRRGKKKKWVKWLIIGLVVVGFIVYVVISAKEKAEELAAAMAANVQEAQIKKMDITSSIAATGTIQSKDVRTLTSPLAGVKIDEVNVKVGDMVSQGDVVVTFSRESINKKIGQLEEDIVEAKTVKGLDAGDRTNSYVSGFDGETYSVATAYDAMLKAEKDLNKAKEDLSRACSDKSDFKSLHDEAKEKVESVEEEILWYERELRDNPNWPDEKKAEYTSAEDHLRSKYNKYRDAIDNYDKNIESLESAERKAQTQVDSAQRDYDTAVVKYNKAGHDASFNDAKAEYNYNKGNVKANDDVKNLQRQLEQQSDSLDDYIVTAPISGLVTAVNAQQGNGYQANTGALMTIQAVDIFEVSTQIDEYDINNVHLGQKVIIMTDATGEDELEGTITFIAPTATSASGGTGNSSNTSAATTFEVKIDINNKDERLRLGMTAKLNIIKDSHNGVLAVPYDAIEEQEGGKYVIHVVDKNAAPKESLKDEIEGNENGIQVVGLDGAGAGKPETEGFEGFPTVPGSREIPVQIGLEGNYFTEIISPDIKEGMTVLINSEAGEVNDMDMFGGPM